MKKAKNNLEVCFSPVMFPFFDNPEAVVAVVDILRATSSIITAFHNGVEKLIPVPTLDEARGFKNKGFLIAAERDGQVLDFADFGNSPDNFTRERVQGRTIVYSTTNGTQAVQQAGHCYQVVIGGYLNLSALVRHLTEMDRDVVILCAAWKNRFSLEDSVFAGALASMLLDSGRFTTICDSAKASMDLWTLAKSDLLGYIQKAAQKSRLGRLNLDDAIPYCHEIDVTEVIPVLVDGVLRIYES